jgi:hypothetical protein
MKIGPLRGLVGSRDAWAVKLVALSGAVGAGMRKFGECFWLRSVDQSQRHRVAELNVGAGRGVR